MRLPGLDLLYWIVYSNNDEDGELSARLYASAITAFYLVAVLIGIYEVFEKIYPNELADSIKFPVSYILALGGALAGVDHRRTKIIDRFKSLNLDGGFKSRLAWTAYAAFMLAAIVAASVLTLPLAALLTAIFALAPMQFLLAIKGRGG